MKIYEKPQAEPTGEPYAVTGIPLSIACGFLPSSSLLFPLSCQIPPHELVSKFLTTCFKASESSLQVIHFPKRSPI